MAPRWPKMSPRCGPTGIPNRPQIEASLRTSLQTPEDQFWSHFGRFWGPFWHHSGMILGPFWDDLGTILGQTNILKTTKHLAKNKKKQVMIIIIITIFETFFEFQTKERQGQNQVGIQTASSFPFSSKLGCAPQPKLISSKEK